MSRILVLSLLVLLALAPLGCGGLSQDDLKQYAIRRPKKNDQAPPAAPATADSNTANTAIQTAPAAMPQTPPAATQNTPSQTRPAAAANSRNTSPASKPTANPTTVASAGNSSLSSANPLDSPTPASLSANPDSAAEPASSTEAVADDDPPPVITEDSTPAEIQEYHTWHYRRRMKEQAKQEAAERKADQEAGKKAATPPTSADESSYVSTNTYDDAQALKALFDRLTNPETLTPEELGRVAQELAYDDATKEALLYEYAWLITTEKTDEVKKRMTWSPGLQRPVAAIHWGLGLEFSGDPRLLEKADPIGSDYNVFRNMNRRYNSGKLKTYVGELGDRLLFGLDDEISSGSLGVLLEPPANDGQRPRAMNLKWQASPIGFSPETLGRGITLLKGGTRKELLYIAKSEGVDILVIYDMNLKQGQSGTKKNHHAGPVVNITELKLLDIAKNKEIYSTGPLNNIKTRWARQNRAEKDPVEKVFEDLFAFVDESLTLGPLPGGLNEENATARIEALAASEPANPLPAMAEMRLYQALSLVGDVKLYAGYKALIGDGPAKKLITGTAAERVAAVAPYLPKAESKN